MEGKCVVLTLFPLSTPLLKIATGPAELGKDTMYDSVQQLSRNDETTNFASLVKSAFGIFYVYLVFLF